MQLLSRRCRTGVNSDRITCPSVLRFQHFSTSLSLALTRWFSRHVSLGVYALHITHTQRWLIKVSAEAPWKVAWRIIAPAIWQTQHEQSFPLSFFRSSRFWHLACYLILLASLFGALFAVCVAEIVFYLRLPARVRERERIARIARQLQSWFHGGFEGDEGCLLQVAPSNVNLQILTSKCCSGHSKLLDGTFLRCSTTNVGPGERWVGVVEVSKTCCRAEALQCLFNSCSAQPTLFVKFGNRKGNRENMRNRLIRYRIIDDQIHQAFPPQRADLLAADRYLCINLNNLWMWEMQSKDLQNCS